MPAIADGDPDAEVEADVWARDVECIADQSARLAGDEESEVDEYESALEQDCRRSLPARLIILVILFHGLSAAFPWGKNGPSYVGRWLVAVLAGQGCMSGLRREVVRRAPPDNFRQYRGRFQLQFDNIAKTFFDTRDSTSVDYGVPLRSDCSYASPLCISFAKI